VHRATWDTSIWTAADRFAHLDIRALVRAITGHDV
jgi:hypothetical protein